MALFCAVLAVAAGLVAELPPDVPRDRTVQALRSVRASWTPDPASLDVSVRNRIELGAPERYEVRTAGPSALLALRVDSYGGLEVLSPGPKGWLRSPGATAMSIPPNGEDARCLGPIGEAEIFVFALPHEVPPDRLGLEDALGFDAAGAALVAERLRSELAKLDGILASHRSVSIAPRSGNSRGPGDADYTVEDIERFFATDDARSMQRIRCPGLVHFESGKERLTPASLRNLDTWAEYLKRPKVVGRRFAIEGHTDDVGKEPANLLLSERRAKEVRDFLVSRGVPADHLVAEPFGERFPIISGRTDEARAQNRRVDFRLIRSE